MKTKIAYPPPAGAVPFSGAYSDLSGKPTLGTAAALDVGATASKVVQLDGSAKLPAVDGSQLTNLPIPAGYTQPTAAAAIGTYALLYNGTGGARAPGDTAAGSSLSWASSDGSATTATTGTWRIMGISNPTGVSVWLRIS